MEFQILHLQCPVDIGTKRIIERNFVSGLEWLWYRAELKSNPTLCQSHASPETEFLSIICFVPLGYPFKRKFWLRHCHWINFVSKFLNSITYFLWPAQIFFWHTFLINQTYPLNCVLLDKYFVQASSSPSKIKDFKPV